MPAVCLKRLRKAAAVLSVATAVFAGSCASSRVDLRTLLPRNTLIYIETNNLAGTLRSQTENNSFRIGASKTIDFSAVEGIQFAVGVTGFESDEKQVGDGQSILNLKPKFIAVAETNAWGYQVEGLVNETINGFINKVYGPEAKLVRSTQNGSERYVWTAADGRMVYAEVIGSQIFFGNDEASLTAALAAKNGSGENLSKRADLIAAYKTSVDSLAFGFVSNEGIKKISDLIGITVAVGQSEDENTRGFISRVLPGILSGMVEEAVWVSNGNGTGIEDRLVLKTKKEVSAILNDTITPAALPKNGVLGSLPSNIRSVTQYNLRNPQIAFRSAVLLASESAGPVDGSTLTAFSNSLFEPYGVDNAEVFLSAVGSEIYTIGLDEDGDRTVAMGIVKDFEKLKSSISKEIVLDVLPDEKLQGRIWKSAADDLAVAFVDGYFVIGDPRGVAGILENWKRGIPAAASRANDFSKSLERLKQYPAVSYSSSLDTETHQRLLRIFGAAKDKPADIKNWVAVSTKFTPEGIERRYISDFGFIGTIVGQFDSE